MASASPERIAQLEEIRRRRIDAEYKILRDEDPALYKRCVEAASAIGFRHAVALARLPEPQRLALIADVEAVLVSLALEVRGG